MLFEVIIDRRTSRCSRLPLRNEPPRFIARDAANPDEEARVLTSSRMKPPLQPAALKSTT